VDHLFGGAAGGIAGLEQLLAEHWDTLEADFRRFYHLRLAEAVYGHAGREEGRLPAREVLNLIHQLLRIPESGMVRTLRGSMADWDLTALLLRQIDLRLAGANWQRGGGKGQRPEPIPLPEDGRGQAAASGRDVAVRLRNLGLIPATD